MQQEAILRAQQMAQRGGQLQQTTAPSISNPKSAQPQNKVQPNTTPQAQQRPSQGNYIPRGPNTNVTPDKGIGPKPVPQLTPIVRSKQPQSKQVGGSPLGQLLGGLNVKELLKTFGLDNDRLLIILLIVILMNEEADMMLILALGYIML